MKNYEEKEKKLENVLKKLNTMSNRVIKMNNDINSLNFKLVLPLFFSNSFMSGV